MRLTLLCAMLAACGTDPHGHDTNGTLTIGPASSTLTITNGAPVSEDFTATLTYPDGTSRDATDETIFTIDSAYGAFAMPGSTRPAPAKQPCGRRGPTPSRPPTS